MEYMPNFLSIEEQSTNTPLLCIYGENELVNEAIIDEYSKKFRIILVSGKKPDFLERADNIYFLTYENAQLFPKLEETIDYAVVFLTKDKSINFLSYVTSKLTFDKAHILYVTSALFLQEHVSLINELKETPYSNFALLGEVLTPNILDEKGDLSKIIANAILNKEIRLAGNEALPVYGITIQDALTGISRLLFGNFKHDTFYFLFYEHPQTVLETVHLIGRVDPEIKIHFSDTSNEITIPSHIDLIKIIDSNLKMEERYLDFTFDGFEKGLVSLIERGVVENNGYLKNHNKGDKHKAKKNDKFVNSLRFVLLSFFFGTFLFLFTNLVFLGLSLFFLRSAINGLESNNFANVSRDAKASQSFLLIIKPAADLAINAINVIDKHGKVEGAYIFVTRVQELSETAGNTLSVLNNNVSKETLSSSISNFSFLYQEGQRIVLETGNTTLKKNLNKTYSKLLSFSEVLPNILGFDKEKEYLLLFQNDEELRPTGGFIGSVGDLNIKNGKIEKLTIRDVYELDGQLKNHIEPPFAVRRYLQPHLYLRDSNFFLNYQETASAAAYLYNLETDKKPDAVIAINLKVLKEILKISGPIKLPAYNVTVTDNTVSDFLESTIKNNFFPGSTQKKDVINSVLNQLILKSSKDPKFNIGLVKLLPVLLEEKDILASFSNDSIQRIFSANSYAGEYHDTRAQNAKTLNDYLYINEANIGVNKANAHINREVSYKTTIGQGKLMSKAILTLTNTGTDDYKTYTKIVVPKGSNLQQILINGEKQNIIQAITDAKIYEGKNFKLPPGLEVEQFNKDGFEDFGFVITAKKGEKTTAEIDYDNGAFKPLSTIVIYSLHYVKQPGTSPYPLTTSVDYPDGFVPVNTSADSYGKNFLEKNTLINNDFDENIELQKNSLQK